MTLAANPCDRPWPPLIVATDVPRWVKWRDAVLTLLMWTLLAFMLDSEITLIFGPHLERLGLGPFDSEGDWSGFFEQLIPFLQVAAVAVFLLFIAGLFTWRRQTRAFLLPEPPPLAIADQARRAGLDEAALSSARDLRIAVVHVEPNGRLRIETRADAV